MAGAYATFADSGQQHDPYSVEKITSKDGTVFEHSSVAKAKDAFSSQVADNVTDVLKTVVDKGTGTAAQLTGREVAGKTGTTDGNKSAWFVGYTPQLSTSIGMYRLDDDASNKSRTFLEMYGTGGEKKIHGASFPAQIWHDYMEQALKGTKAEPFPTPEPIGKVLNDTPSPSATPSTTLSPSASPTPSTSPSPSLSSSPTASPTDTCGNFGWNCGNNGGTNAGSTGGATGTTSPTPTATNTSGSTRGNGNGGIFAGQNGG
jgi:membrane peptidoglycan carboxypeptidase